MTSFVVEVENNRGTAKKSVQPFSEQEGSHLRKVTSIFKNVVSYLSGGEPDKLIGHYLEKNVDVKMKMNPNLKIFVSSVKNLYTYVQKGEKTKVLSLVAAHFSASYLSSMGFKFSSSSYARARKKQVWENKHFVLPSKKEISNDEKRKINQFLMNHSTIASNRTKNILLPEYCGSINRSNVCINLIFF